jgi:NTP pyrophosphatase (non-canonical NTP hydrolase)
MEENKVFASAISVFGAKHQEDIAIEEMSELTQALLHNRRGRGSNIPEEIADVLIAVEQLIMIHGCREEVERIRKEKIERLAERTFEHCL